MTPNLRPFDRRLVGLLSVCGAIYVLLGFLLVSLMNL